MVNTTPCRGCSKPITSYPCVFCGRRKAEQGGAGVWALLIPVAGYLVLGLPGAILGIVPALYFMGRGRGRPPSP